MNLLCPNCQKMLNVPEQYAGQLMKCPLCSGTFTVPALPDTGVSTAEPVAPAARPAAPAPPPMPAPAPAPTPAAPAHAEPEPEPEVYGIRHDHHDHASTAPPPPPEWHAPAANVFEDLAAPAVEEHAHEPPPPNPSRAPSPMPPGDYTRTWTVWFSPRILQWVPAAAVVLVFFLQFFSWLGYYPGEVACDTQSAYGAAFGYLSYEDAELKNESPFRNDAAPAAAPRVSFFTLFYWLLFIPTLVITVGVAVLPFVQVKLPPAVENLLPWRWGIIALLNVVLFFFLILQLLLNFSFETQVKEWVDKKMEANKAEMEKKKVSKNSKEIEVERGRLLEPLQRKWPLTLTVLLHLLALATAGFVYWMGKQEGRPMPKLELLC
jgi:hypothetical protein